MGDCRKLAVNVVDTLLEELKGRSGIDGALDSIDSDTMEELEETLYELAEEKIRDAGF